MSPKDDITGGRQQKYELAGDGVLQARWIEDQSGQVLEISSLLHRDFMEGGKHVVMYFLVGLILIACWVLGGIVCLWVTGILGFKWQKRSWVIAVIFFVGPILLVLVFSFVGWMNSKVRPSRADILGDYKVDRGFCPGKQADWQHEIYSLKITEKWIEIRDVRTEKIWREEIDWVTWSEYRWRFKVAPAHHMIRGGPAIVREKLGYYYIFESPLYGVVRFRKEGVTMKLKLLTGVGFLLVVLMCWWLAKIFQKKCIRQ